MLSMATILTIDGVDLPAPSTFKAPLQDLDSEDTYRNELGYIQRDRIRAGIYKVPVSWKGVTNSDAVKILNAVSPASFKASFPTPWGRVTKTMYAGDRDVEMIKYDNDNSIRWDISFNLTEV